MVASSDTTPQLKGPNTSSAGHSLSQVSTSHAVPDLQFVFRIDEFYFPGEERIKRRRRMKDISEKLWMCGSSIYEIAELPATFTLYDSKSVHYGSGTYLVGQDEPANSIVWNKLSFLHNDEDFSSSIHPRGTHPKLRCQRTGSVWPWTLFPEVYHGPFHASPPYGGLRGSLSIFLALLALSIKPDNLEEDFPKLRNNGQWGLPKYSHGRKINRGVTVYIYVGTESGTTPKDIHAYESGVYGNYFD